MTNEMGEPLTSCEEHGLVFAAERPVIAFDIDSTVSDSSWRVPLINNWDAQEIAIEDRAGMGMRPDGMYFHDFRWGTRNERYDKFYSLAVHDKPYEIAVGLVHQLREVFDIIYVTGRPETWRADTVGWLAEHELMPLGRAAEARSVHAGSGWIVDDSRRWLLMRPDGWFAPAAECKMHLLDRSDMGLPIMMFDDDVSVVQALNGEGIAASLVLWHGDEPRGMKRG